MDPEPCDLCGLEPQLAKDLLGVLAEERGPATHPGRGPCRFEGHTERLEGPRRAVIDRLHHRPRGRLGIGEGLPPIVDAVAGRAAIVVNGGFTRGTAVLKGLALGATVVAVGRTVT